MVSTEVRWNSLMHILFWNFWFKGKTVLNIEISSGLHHYWSSWSCSCPVVRKRFIPSNCFNVKCKTLQLDNNNNNKNAQWKRKSRRACFHQHEDKPTISWSLLFNIRLLRSLDRPKQEVLDLASHVSLFLVLHFGVTEISSWGNIFMKKTNKYALSSLPIRTFLRDWSTSVTLIVFTLNAPQNVTKWKAIE